jgi:RNA polymerase sigma-70 factor (ECF subfamily)
LINEKKPYEREPDGQQSDTAGHAARPRALQATAHQATLDLIAHILSGEKVLFHDLIRPIERQVYIMLFSILRNETDAEDAAQETMIKVYRNLATFRGDAKFSTWVISIARNEGLGRLRKRASSLEQPLEEYLSSSQTNSSESAPGDYTPALLTDWREVPLEALERSELRGCLSRAVLSLPTIYREVVQLRDIDELDVEETAKVLGITQGAVKVRLHRARTMLQKELVPLLKNFASKKSRNWFGRRV